MQNPDIEKPTPNYASLDEVDQWEDCDGESILINIRDSSIKGWGWHWVPIEIVGEYGRTDIIDEFYPRAEDE